MNRFARGVIDKVVPPDKAATPPPPRVNTDGPLAAGDLIGPNYEVLGILGEGGFGRVYLARNRDSGNQFAVKTLRNRFMRDPGIRARFEAEANVWVDLGTHPNIVQALFVREYDGRLYIGLEYIAPDANGITSLEGHLDKRDFNLKQALGWAIDCCRGLEFGYSKGMRAHRDIKPSNILMDGSSRARITDFGLAGALGGELRGQGMGTIYYMPPEQWDDVTTCDERSDLYSFGVVLYQLTHQRSALPFRPWTALDDTQESWEDMLHELYSLHVQAPVPELDSPVRPIVERLLQKEPVRRYESFTQLRGDLEWLLKRVGGEVTSADGTETLSADEWMRRGSSLAELGRLNEALACHDRAIALDPNLREAWQHRSDTLEALGRHNEALVSAWRVVEMQPDDRDGWVAAGIAFAGLERHDEALAALKRALEFDPSFAYAWYYVGLTQKAMGNTQDALAAFRKAVHLNPQFGNAWIQLGGALAAIGKPEEAIPALRTGLQINPASISGWYTAGNTFRAIGSLKDAVAAYERIIELDPEHVDAWFRRGACLLALGMRQGSYESFHQVTELKPEWDLGWHNAGIALCRLHRYAEAVVTLDRAIDIDPNQAATWTARGDAMRGLNRNREALVCYSSAVKVEPAHENAWMAMGDLLLQLGDVEKAAGCQAHLDAIRQGRAGSSPPGR